jgi:outer membrane protein assembly factor BamB
LGLTGADWRQFRGPLQSGSATAAKLPTKWGENENIAWKVDLPGRGLSGPIVVGDRVFLTASRGFRDDRLFVLCFDAKTGSKIWERQLRATGRTTCFPTMSMATPTPASDGKHVVAFYSCNDLTCFDLDGNLLWLRGLTHDYPNASNSVGMASSPVIVGDTVVVQVENAAESFAAGLDLETGVNKWKLDRPASPSWASPLVLPRKDGKGELVLLQSADRLSAHNPSDGKTEWEFKADCSTIPSGTFAEGAVMIPVSKSGLVAIRAEVASKAPEILWKEPKLMPSMSSPVSMEGRIYSINGVGVLTAGSLTDGKVQWQLRLGGKYSSSPVAAGGYIYVFNQDGTCVVVRPSEDKGVIVSKNELKETIECTPAVAGNALYVRSDKHLWKIAEK